MLTDPCVCRSFAYSSTSCAHHIRICHFFFMLLIYHQKYLCGASRTKNDNYYKNENSKHKDHCHDGKPDQCGGSFDLCFQFPLFIFPLSPTSYISFLHTFLTFVYTRTFTHFFTVTYMRIFFRSYPKNRFVNRDLLGLCTKKKVNV